MSAGWGVDATVVDGVVTSGTSSKDVRNVWGALYSPGIISGAIVSTSSTAMTYSISAGVVAISVASGETVLAPVPSVTIGTPNAPASGSRVDIIWVRQKSPSVDRSSDTVVECGTVKPAGALEIARYQVSAGATSTSKAVRTGNTDYSIPYGSNLGQLHYWQDKQSKALSTDGSITRNGHGSFYLPTDRMVTFKYSNVLSALGASGYDNSKYCEYGFLVNVDGGDILIWTTPGLHQSQMTVTYEVTVELSAGTHTTNIGIRRQVGPGQGYQVYGLVNGYGRRGAEFTVLDAGPVK